MTRLDFVTENLNWCFKVNKEFNSEQPLGGLIFKGAFYRAVGACCWRWVPGLLGSPALPFILLFVINWFRKVSVAPLRSAICSREKIYLEVQRKNMDKARIHGVLHRDTAYVNIVQTCWYLDTEARGLSSPDLMKTLESNAAARFVPEEPEIWGSKSHLRHSFASLKLTRFTKNSWRQRWRDLVNNPLRASLPPVLLRFLFRFV